MSNAFREECQRECGRYSTDFFLSVYVLNNQMREKYAADSSEVLRSFEAFGDIKHHFDLVSNRGMLFVTYVCRISGSDAVTSS